MHQDTASHRSRAPGFTLIEVMIVVAIIAILVAVALPSYRDYVLRGQLVNATSLLSTGQANMERYFQDNRQYTDTTGSGGAAITAPCAASQGSFTMSCASGRTATQYTLTATGSGAVQGFSYTVDQRGTQSTTIQSPAPWPAVTGATCWIVKKGQTCS